MLKVTINYSELNDGFRIGYFLKALGMVRTENCFWTEIYTGQNPDAKYIYAVLKYEDKKPSTPNSEWQQKVLEFMEINLINAPTPADFNDRYGLAIIEGNDIITAYDSTESLSKVFDTWHRLIKHVPKAKIAVLSRKSIKGKSSGKVTLYTVDYNGVGFNSVGRRFFTNMQDAKEFAKKPLRDKPIKRTYTYANAKQIIEEQDLLDAWAQMGVFVPDYE